MDFKTYKITTPIKNSDITNLQTGDMVYATGYIYTLRDAGHKKLIELIENDKQLPIDFEGNIVYYAGPCPNKPSNVIGSIGPTTSGRMDLYSPTLIEKGLKYMIGKGMRSNEVNEKIAEYNGMYFIAIGGAAAKISKCVRSVEVVAFSELGTEALRKMYVEDLPVIVATDTNGNNIYNNNI